ncbi:MAG: adenylate/guanylate cyclase domain-containing protein [Acidimicrobiia bacterium]
MNQPSAASTDVVALNADVVGYSALMADDFETTTSAMGDIRRIVEENVTGIRGTLVNFVGDNFMAVFADSKDAMQSAIAITRALEAYNGEGQARQLRFRMGLDQGPVTVSGDQYFGDALNVATRIQALAPVGGVSISGRVYRSLDEPALRFQSVGRKALKNIPEEVEVFRFTDLPTEGGAPSAAGGLSLAEPTVAERRRGGEAGGPHRARPDGHRGSPDVPGRVGAGVGKDQQPGHQTSHLRRHVRRGRQRPPLHG